MKTANYEKMYLKSFNSCETSLNLLKTYLIDGDPSHLINSVIILRNSQLACEEIYLETTEDEMVCCNLEHL
ncbi:MAG: hypothetical protein R3Y35_02345 [Clostridia bacterium]